LLFIGVGLLAVYVVGWSKKLQFLYVLNVSKALSLWLLAIS